MKHPLKKLLLISFILAFFSSLSYANLKKGTLDDQQTRVFEFSTSAQGFTTVILVFDNKLTDLDLGIADDEGNLISSGLSEQRHLELLQTGLPQDRTFLLIVDSFEGGGPFRLLVNNSSQGVIGVASPESGAATLKEVPLDSRTKKVRDQLRALSAKHKK